MRRFTLIELLVVVAIIRIAKPLAFAYNVLGMICSTRLHPQSQTEPCA